MAIELATGSAAERALLAETALGEAALGTDPATDAALANETVVQAAPLPTAAVLDEERMLEDLVALLASEDPVAAYVEYMKQHVTDGPSFIAFLRAAYRAPLEDALAQCELDPQVAAQGAKQLAATFGPFLLALGLEVTHVITPGTSIHLLLSSNPGFAANGMALVMGIFEGLIDSKVASAETVFQILEANVALTVLLPLHAACFIAGTIYQLLKDIYDTAMTLIQALGYADEIIPFVCRLMAALPVALGHLLDAESADDVALLGTYLGQMLASSLQDYVPALHAASTYGEIAWELAEFSFNCGTIFGPLLLDILLSVIGIGYVEAAIKLLGKAVSFIPDVIQWIFALLRRLFDAVDPGLFDDLLAFGVKLAGRLSARMSGLADEAAAAYGFTKESIENGFQILEETLGTERFRKYTGSVFCTLEP